MSENGGGMIPEARFSEVISERNEARARIQQLEDALKKATAKADRLVEQHAEALEKMQTQHQESLLELEVSSVLSDIDDPDVRDLLKRKHANLEVEEGQERPAFREWFGQYRETDPAILRPFQKSPEPATEFSQPAAAAQAPALPLKPTQPAHDPAVQPGPTPGTAPPLSGLTPQQLARMPKEQLEAYGGTAGVLRTIFGGGEQ